ncbi:MAG: hypothetical protein LBU47_06010 [Christensenellaceae bacterium]|jgi:hypothetical protein|nr:hypothetical protein [Christensenellaceae bacterium]
MGEKSEKRVLFVGNSHTYFNDMPRIFSGLAAAAGRRVGVSMLAQPGVTFGWHLQSPDLRFALLHGGFDAVFFQQAAHSPAPAREETLRDGAELIRRAKACGMRQILTVPWAEREKPERQAAMLETFSSLAAATGAECSPVGVVFERVLKERPDIDLYWLDGAHCSPLGSYVNALCAYATFFHASPEGLPAASLSTHAEDGRPYEMKAAETRLDEEACALLQRFVWQASREARSGRRTG